MRIPLKLNAIEQEHLQELYDEAGVARDHLPYTEQFEKLCEDFQDRTFKNAEPEQVYGALLRYTRSSSNPPGENEPSVELTPEQIEQVRLGVRRHGSNGKLAPYSSEFETALKEFNDGGTELSPRDFWLAICKAHGRTRKPPAARGTRSRSKAKAKAEATEANDE